MKPKFDPAEFVRRVGRDLVSSFESAREATTPGLVGGAIENAVRNRLEQILPRGIGVGTGCVIDIHGGTSRQIDVVLYEKELCPRFSVNENSETSYFPVESVLAVGEVKSVIGKVELNDAFKKIASVKSLYRSFEKMDGNVYVGRRYSDSGSATALGFYRDNTNLGDVLGFVLAERSNIAVTLPDPSKTHKSAPKATLLGHYVENVTTLNNDVLCPDTVVFLDGTVLVPYAANGLTPYVAARVRNVLPHLIHPVKADSPFGELIKTIWKRHREGITAHIPLERYLHFEAKTEPKLTWAVIANFHQPDQNELKVGERLEITTPTDHLRSDLQYLARNRT